MQIAGKFFGMIVVGMMLEHEYSRIMSGAEFQWYAEILEIDVKKNTIKVKIVSKSGNSISTWNLSSTQVGLESGEYLEILIAKKYSAT